MANSLLHINREVALSTDRERERGGHEERERGGTVHRQRERGGATKRERGGHEETERSILPVRSVDQRLVESIRVTMAQPIRISLGFCEHL